MEPQGDRLRAEGVTILSALAKWSKNARKFAYGKTYTLQFSALEHPYLDHARILDSVDSEYSNGISVYSIICNDDNVHQSSSSISGCQCVYGVILGFDPGIYLCISHPSPQSSMGIPLRSIFSVHIVAAYNILFPYAARFALDDPRNQQKEKISLARFLRLSNPIYQ